MKVGDLVKYRDDLCAEKNWDKDKVGIIMSGGTRIRIGGEYTSASWHKVRWLGAEDGDWGSLAEHSSETLQLLTQKETI